MSNIPRTSPLLWLLLTALLAGQCGCARRCGRQKTPPAQVRQPPRPPQTAGLSPRVLPGSREPSGAVALPGLGGILVVDDEPSDSPTEGIHFMRVTDEGLVSLPVHIAAEKLPRWDDWEGATSDGKHVYLLGSHAHQDAKRSKICRIALASTHATETRLEIRGPIRCTGGDAQRLSIERTLMRAAKAQGFSLPEDWRNLRPKKGGLNLESIYFHGPSGKMYIGLRSPLAWVGSQQHAILLTLSEHKGQNRFAFAGLINLQDRGIRALGAGPKGSVLISAGRVGPGGAFDLYQVASLPAAPFQLDEPKCVTPQGLHRYHSWFKPEALVLYDQYLYVFSDSGEWDHEPAHYLQLPIKTGRTWIY